MSKFRKRWVLSAAAACLVLGGAIWLIKADESDPLRNYFDEHPRVRNVVRSACACVGMDDEFDSRFGGIMFYVRFTN